MSKEITKQYLVSAIKGAIAAIPYIGTAINEFAFEARGRIKQNRVNSFIDEFSNYIGQVNGQDLKIEEIKKEDFGDFFEETIIAVSKTSSQIKREAFKILLANQIIQPKKLDYALLLVQTISNLHEQQIPILKGIYEANSHEYHTETGNLIELRKKSSDTDNALKEKYLHLDSMDEVLGDREIEELEDKMKTINKGIEKAEKRISELKPPFQAATYNIEDHEYYILIQDLCNKGLLIDNGMQYGSSPHELIEISGLGIKLLESLEEN